MREKTERDLSSISYYVALAHFKLACIVEAKVARASIGQDPPAFGEQFSRMVLGLIEDAEKIARSSRL